MFINRGLLKCWALGPIRSFCRGNKGNGFLIKAVVSPSYSIWKFGIEKMSYLGGLSKRLRMRGSDQCSCLM